MPIKGLFEIRVPSPYSIKSHEDCPEFGGKSLTDSRKSPVSALKSSRRLVRELFTLTNRYATYGRSGKFVALARAA